MMCLEAFKWIRVTAQTHEKLADLGRKDETYNDIIEALLEHSPRVKHQGEAA